MTWLYYNWFWAAIAVLAGVYAYQWVIYL